MTKQFVPSVLIGSALEEATEMVFTEVSGCIRYRMISEYF